MQDLTGHDIGRYHIIQQIGEGGMAVVYKAYDNRLERDVAIKLIRRDIIGPSLLDLTLKRFEREAKSLAKLSHNNILKIYDYGEHDGSPYLVMEYLRGGTLKDRMGEAVALGEAIKLILPVARALQYAHEQGIIHRDVKPANILVNAQGEPMLTDFGIAKLLDTGEAPGLTGTNVGIGTPEYMAPEQGTSLQFDYRADIYSLGVVFYELVTGRKPFQADTPLAILIKHVSDPLPRPKQFMPDLPDEVETVIFKAMAKKPQDRYEEMKAFAEALEKLAGNYDQLLILREQQSENGAKRSLNEDAMQLASVVGQATAANVQATALTKEPVKQPGDLSFVANSGIIMTASQPADEKAVSLLKAESKYESAPIFTQKSESIPKGLPAGDKYALPKKAGLIPVIAIIAGVGLFIVLGLILLTGGGLLLISGGIGEKSPNPGETVPVLTNEAQLEETPVETMEEGALQVSETVTPTIGKPISATKLQTKTLTPEKGPRPAKTLTLQPGSVSEKWKNYPGSNNENYYFRVENDFYIMQLKNPKVLGAVFPTAILGDSKISISSVKRAGGLTRVGAICRSMDGDALKNGYAGILSEDGIFYIVKFSNMERTELSRGVWKPRQDGHFSIQLSCTAEKIKLQVADEDGEKAIEASDSEFKAGHSGILLESGDDKPVEVWFEKVEFSM